MVVFRDPSCVAERRQDSIDIRMLDFSTLITTQSQCTCYSIILKQSKNSIYDKKNLLYTLIWKSLLYDFSILIWCDRSILPEVERNRVE